MAPQSLGDRPEIQLARRWGAIARRKFADAADEPDAVGRRLIEHGAACYFNCARDLLAAVGHTEVSLDLGLEVFLQDGKGP